MTLAAARADNNRAPWYFKIQFPLNNIKSKQAITRTVATESAVAAATTTTAQAAEEADIARYQSGDMILLRKIDAE